MATCDDWIIVYFENGCFMQIVEQLIWIIKPDEVYTIIYEIICTILKKELMFYFERLSVCCTKK